LKESKDAIDSIMSAFQLNERPDAYRVYVDGGWIYFGKNDEEKANNEAVKVNSNVEALYNRT
jgi:hypothetical protein